ncbi:MAG: hypothetical protein JWP13_858, partial [Candidatus Saccharibacteria bacterium]|nr:hypothetical protein [Candidatus Saccharibacteria bacterium]
MIILNIYKEIAMTYPENGQTAILEQAQQPNLGIVRPVGEESVAVITRLSAREDTQEYVGNILRRTCEAAGELSCQAVCIRRGTPEYDENLDRLCADRNLAQGLNRIGINPEDVLMVAVTGNEVGFGDELDAYREAGKLKSNAEGWQELPGFNAFFARPEELPAIGSRLADCAHFEFEFTDSEGRTVIGFEHGTRDNMKGRGAYAFEIDESPVTYTEYVLTTALRHYGANPSSLRIRLSSSIRGENFKKHFDSREAMEAHIPGWLEAGFLANATNPRWHEGEPVVKEDEWHADTRGMMLHD